MRDISAGLKTDVSDVHHTLCWLARFVMADGTIFRVSSISSAITINVGNGSETYSPDISFKGATLKFSGDGEVPDGQITAPIALLGTYTDEDAFVGTFEGMQVTLYVVNYEDASVGGVQLGPYTASELIYDDRGTIAAFEVRGILQRAKDIQVEELSVGCRSNLGDPRPGYCNLPLYPDDVERTTAYAVGDYVRHPTAGNYGNRMFRCTTAGTTAGSAPAYNYTVAATTTDGTAVFTAEEAWVRSAVVATVTNNGDFTLTLTESRSVDNWFANGGYVHWTSGYNDGLTNHTREYTHSTKRFQLWGTARWTVQVGDTCEVMPGCDKTFAMCLSRFSMTINFRGEHQLPGTDLLNGAGL